MEVLIGYVYCSWSTESADQIESPVMINHTSTDMVYLTWAAPSNPNGVIVIHEVRFEKIDDEVNDVGDERDAYTVVQSKTTPKPVVCLTLIANYV